MSSTIDTITTFQTPDPNSASVNQSVTLTANVMEMTGRPVLAGIVDFEEVNSDGSDTVLASAQIVQGTGTASTTYAFPNPGQYTLIAHFEENDVDAASDSSQQVETVQASGQVSTQMFIAPLSTSYSTSQQQLSLSATVKDQGGHDVPEGEVNFTLEYANNQQPVTGAEIDPNPAQVSNGTVSTTLTLPAGLAAGDYFIEGDYSDAASGTYANSVYDGTLTIDQLPTITQVNVSSPQSYNNDSQTPPTMQLSATVTSGDSTVSEGGVNFSLLHADGSAVTGAQITPTGPFTATLMLPPGLAHGQYTVQAAYSDDNPGNFASSSSTTTDNLTIAPASTTVGAVKVNPSQVPFSNGQTPVQVSTKVTSGDNTVNEGKVTFTIAALGIHTAPIPVNSDGTVQTMLTLGPGTAAGAYTVTADYSDDNPGNFGPSASTSGPANLTVKPAASNSGPGGSSNSNTGGSSGNNPVTVSQMSNDLTNLEASLSAHDSNAINADLAVVSNDIGQLQTSAANADAVDRINIDTAPIVAGVRLILDGVTDTTSLGGMAGLGMASQGVAATEQALEDLVQAEISEVLSELSLLM